LSKIQRILFREKDNGEESGGWKTEGQRMKKEILEYYW
jgi:hypothetical protein